MKAILPVDRKERTAIVDVIRGFALIGVLLANFTSYVEQQTPSPILDANSSSLDVILMNINSVFFEWKFMTLFSILFGYGFGLILESLQRKNINPNFFFAKRMSWLFIFGIIHSIFWWGDVLNLYAMSGILLLLFRKYSNSIIFISAILCMLVVPVMISYALRNMPETFTDNDIQGLYNEYKHGNVFDVMKFNLNFYYRMFIASGSNLHDIVETLGRFLFGYFLLRIKWLDAIETKKQLFKKIALFTAPLAVLYLITRWLLINGSLHIDPFLREPVLSMGILCTTCFYVSLLVLAYIFFGMNWFFVALQSLGRMTLTNYLLISGFLIILLYGFGFNKLGEIQIHRIWILAFSWLIIEIIFSTYWLKYFRYGPAEWIWRQLIYGKRLQLKK